jgi:hypothetical protein
MSNLLAFLEAAGCFEKNHSGHTLGEHLINTSAILEAVDAPEEVVLAGGLHSIYGTNAFKTSIKAESDRGMIADLFGSETERLAFIFGRIERPKALEALPDTGGNVQDRVSGELYDLTAKELWGLRLIEAANLLEQGNNLDRFPAIAKTMEFQVKTAS